MKCPSCEAAKRMDAGKLRVLRTRDMGEYVERDRGCPLCNSKFITRELDEASFVAMRNELYELRAKMSAHLRHEAALEKLAEPRISGEHDPRPRDFW